MGDISEELVQKLLEQDDLPEDTKMIPVDMNGFEPKFDDLEALQEKLGVKGTAEAFVKALEHFDKIKEKIDGVEEELTFGAWKEMILFPEGEEEEMLYEGEEEEMIYEGEEEEDGDDEPPSKKAKTD